MNNHKPLSKRKTVQLMVALTILAWATQTLWHQWGFSQDVQPLMVTPDLSGGSAVSQKFMAGDNAGPMGTLELRSEATVTGAEVKLKQLCRWSDTDAATFTSIADLTLARLSDSVPFKAIGIEEIRRTLHDAGVNVALINFAGATTCTVSRSDVRIDEHAALEKWIGMHSAPAGDDTAAGGATTQPAAVPATPAAIPAAATEGAELTKAPADPEPAAEKPQALGELLTNDLCQRLNVARDLMQISFNPEDAKVLALSEPYFKFSIDPSRIKNLGMTSWEVSIVSDSGAEKKVHIDARAKAWENQVIVARPLAYKQLMQGDDFTEQRLLVDTLPDDLPLAKTQCVGQQAARDLKPGTVMTARMVDPVPLVRTGQLVTVTLTQGSVQIKSVARALESGSLGQTIKVRNETTRDIFDVTLTGAQEARLGAVPPGSGVASAGN